MNHRSGELDGAGRAFFSQGRDGRAAGVGQTEQLSGLVEGFAGRIVKRFSEQLVGAELFDAHDLGVAARDE